MRLNSLILTILALLVAILSCIYIVTDAQPMYVDLYEIPYQVQATCSTDTDCGCGKDCLE